ncbi:MAG TPA: glycosyltransferase family 39 protein [Blastocatellia bacterium]|jgi:4-amino-4-deoxy-L-arabinose transferase-like glycosyltransferase
MKAPQDSALTSITDKAKIIEEPPRAAKHTYSFLAVLALASVTFFFGLGLLALVGPDEPRYAEVAREMFAGGDYISPRLCGCLWFEKPVLLYWMSAASYHLFGVSEFAARVPSAAAATATLIFLYCVLRRFASYGLALSAGTVLATSGIFIAYARVAIPDMALTATMSVALLSGYASGLSAGRARWGYWLLTFAATGLAMLAKGLVGIALVLTILVIYFAVIGRLKAIHRGEWAAAVATFIVVASVWYAPVIAKHGRQFIEEFFVRHHFERYMANTFGHPQPFYFFFVVAVAGAAPWTFFLLPAMARLRTLAPHDGGRDALLAFSWIWAAAPILFFSFSGSKLPGYILPAFPALAIIIGAEVERFSGGERGRLLKAGALMTALLLVVTGAAFIFYTNSLSADVSGWRLVPYGFPLASALVSISLLARRKLFAVGAASVVLSVVVATVILLFPKLNDEKSLKSLSLQAAAALKPGERIAFFIRKEFAPVFYAEGRVVCGVADMDVFNALREDILAAALEHEQSLVVITNSNWRAGLESYPRFNTELLAEQGESLAFRVSLKR